MICAAHRQDNKIGSWEVPEALQDDLGNIAAVRGHDQRQITTVSRWCGGAVPSAPVRPPRIPIRHPST